MIDGVRMLGLRAGFIKFLIRQHGFVIYHRCHKDLYLQKVLEYEIPAKAKEIHDWLIQL